MAASDPLDRSALLDDAESFARVCRRRSSESVCCPGCGNSAAIRDGPTTCDRTGRGRRGQRCEACAERFDAFSGTAPAGRHPPLRVRVLCLSSMGLNLPRREITGELGLNLSDVQAMQERPRRGLVAEAPDVGRFDARRHAARHGVMRGQTDARAFTSRSTSSSVCSGEGVRRNRSVPRGTVG